MRRPPGAAPGRGRLVGQATLVLAAAGRGFSVQAAVPAKLDAGDPTRIASSRAALVGHGLVQLEEPPPRASSACP